MEPELIAHADWSLHPRKRWICVARRTPSGWGIDDPIPCEALGGPQGLLQSLRAETEGPIFVGLDLPLGVPAAWAERVGLTDFESWLTEDSLSPPWEDFWLPATTPKEISLHRPFYPKRPGGTSRQQLIDGLGLASVDDLRRRCDRPQKGTTTPCPLFWTLGANQVGKAALTGWRELVVPALQEEGARLWPFAGSLERCLQRPITLAEVYPGEVGHWLGLQLKPGGKRSQEARARNASRLLQALSQAGATPSAALRRSLEEGFGDGAEGEDAFDALVGATGMLWVLKGLRPTGLPSLSSVRSIEGWVLGRRDGP